MGLEEVVPDHQRLCNVYQSLHSKVCDAVLLTEAEDDNVYGDNNVASGLMLAATRLIRSGNAYMEMPPVKIAIAISPSDKVVRATRIVGRSYIQPASMRQQPCWRCDYKHLSAQFQLFAHCALTIDRAIAPELGLITLTIRSRSPWC